MINLKQMLTDALHESSLKEKVNKYEMAIEEVYVTLSPIIYAYTEAAQSCGNVENLTEENARILLNHFLVQKINPNDITKFINTLSELRNHVHKTTNKDSVTSGDTSTLK